MTSVSLVMSDQSINSIGDCDELSKSCRNVLELDLAKNDLNDWNEVSFFVVDDDWINVEKLGLLPHMNSILDCLL